MCWSGGRRWDPQAGSASMLFLVKIRRFYILRYKENEIYQRQSGSFYTFSFDHARHEYKKASIWPAASPITALTMQTRRNFLYSKPKKSKKRINPGRIQTVHRFRTHQAAYRTHIRPRTERTPGLAQNNPAWCLKNHAAELPAHPVIRSRLTGAKIKQTRGRPQRARESVKVSVSDMFRSLLCAVMPHLSAGSYLL